PTQNTALSRVVGRGAVRAFAEHSTLSLGTCETGLARAVVLACSSLIAGRVRGDPVITSAGGRQLSEQQRAAQQVRALAKPYRFRVRADAEGFPIIPGRYGQIEWFDGRP